MNITPNRNGITVIVWPINLAEFMQDFFALIFVALSDSTVAG